MGQEYNATKQVVLYSHLRNRKSVEVRHIYPNFLGQAMVLVSELVALAHSLER